MFHRAITVHLHGQSPFRRRPPSILLGALFTLATLLYNDIPYTIKVAPRARRVTLYVQPGIGLVVSIPKRFAKRDVPEVLAEHDEWIKHSLAELEAQTPLKYRQWPPETLDLKAIDETWHLHFDQNTDQLSGSAGPVMDLRMAQNGADKAAVAALIADVLKRRARRVLPDWVARLAAPHGLSVARVSVRGQRTVWGSYSSSGTLSLNYKLLFLPPRYVDYVILHELAHTRYLNHSAQFWGFLFSLDPDAEELDATMNEVTQDVPPWLDLA